MSLTRGRPTYDADPGPQQVFEREALACLDGLYGAGLRLTRNPADAEGITPDLRGL